MQVVNVPDGWKYVELDQPDNFYLEKGTAFISPRYNIDTLCTELSSSKPDFSKAISGYRVSVNGRYGGDFLKLDEATRSAQISMETMAKKRAVRNG